MTDSVSQTWTDGYAMLFGNMDALVLHLGGRFRRLSGCVSADVRLKISLPTFVSEAPYPFNPATAWVIALGS
jgi:hypothetical protein